MANNTTVNKVEYGGTTVMDITDTTAETNDVLEGEVFYTASGARSVGTLGDATTSTHGLMSAADKTKLDGITAGATANTGTITEITMNGVSKGTSGIVDLGTVITSHQDISGKLNANLKGVANGVAELDSAGKVPSSQLPSYVDDVLEYSTAENFPATGETGKIYVDTTTNKTYRWSGSGYVEISPSLALGETDSTAYRGDRGKTAYTHATDSSRLTTAQSSGLYKIATTAEGHVASATAVQKSDITALGIPDDKIYYVKGSGTDTSGVWTGTISGLTAYYEGLMIAYVPAVSGSVSGTTLNINGLGAAGCYANEVNIYNYYPATTPIIFIYNDSRWEMSDANPTKLSNLIPGDGVYYIDNAINGFNLLFQREANWYTPISSGGTTETSKTMLTNAEFNAFGDIMYYNSSTTVPANTGIRGTAALYWSLNSVDLCYVFNINTETLTKNLPVYLVVTPTSGDKCKIASTTPWAQSLPNTQDGKWYIYLGVSLQTSSNRINLAHNHPVYYHDGTAIRELSPGVHSVQATIDGKLLPSVTSSDNGKVLTVASGAWSAQDPTGGASVTASNVIIASNAWSNGVATVTVNGVTSSNNIIVGMGGNITAEQENAVLLGELVCTAQATNQITVKAFGVTPSVDIPINVFILG